VTPRALRRLERTAFFEHGAAQHAFDQSNFALVTFENYLSCAVKHPCCTLSAEYLISLESFRSDPLQKMSDFMESVDSLRVDDIEGWLRV
jgi:hypothetical protein